MPLFNSDEYKRGWNDYFALNGGFRADLWQQSYSYRQGYRAAEGTSTGRKHHA